MKFSGHQLYRINRNWVFDLTTFIGYRVTVSKKEQVKNYEKAFKIKDNGHGEDLKYTKYIDSIPVGVMRKSAEVTKAYYKEALLCGEAQDS